MKEIIHATIQQLEKSRNIRVLYTCESGSRSWSVPSKDSDYDVRFIYVHPPDWYLSLKNNRDTIRFTRDNLEMIGWELKKALQLLKKSNVALLDWMHAPIIYQQQKDFLPAFRKIGQQCFSPNTVNFHYWSIAKKFHQKCGDPDANQGKYWLYAIRAALSCLWINQKQSLPPVPLQKMTGLATPACQKDIQELLNLKQNSETDFFFSGTKNITSLIEEGIQVGESGKKRLPGGKVNMNEIDSFFRTMVRNNAPRRPRRATRMYYQK